MKQIGRRRKARRGLASMLHARVFLAAACGAEHGERERERGRERQRARERGRESERSLGFSGPRQGKKVSS